jgi:hypothetical protein
MADDTNTAAPDLDVFPSKPFSPVAPLPEISYAAAVSRKAELLGNEEWRTKYLAGDVTAKAEMDQIVKALTPAPPQPSAPDSVDGLEEWVRGVADVSEGVIEEIRTARPVSPLERRLAVQRKESRFNDPTFVERYFAGDPDAKREVLLINVILASPVRDPQTQ